MCGAFSMSWTTQGLELAHRSSATVHARGIKDVTTTLSGGEPPLKEVHHVGIHIAGCPLH